MENKTKGENLQKHGGFSKVTLLRGESQSEYDALRASLYDEWQPNGPSEEHEVKGLLTGYWADNRLDKYWATKLALSAASGELAGAKRAANLQTEELASLEKAIGGAKNFSELDKVLDDAGPPFNGWKRTQDLSYALVVKTTQQMLELYAKSAAVKDETALLLELGYDSDLIDQQLRSYDRVHAKIARHLKLLVHLKSMKEIIFPKRDEQTNAGPKLIASK